MAAAKPTDPHVEGFEILRAPFDEDQIGSVTKGSKVLSNVAPHYYIKKLIDSGLTYDVESLGGPTVHKFREETAVITQAVRVTIGTQKFDGIGSEPVPVPYKDEPQADYLDRLAFAFKNALSDSLKIALKAAGVGLDLYRTAPQEVEEKPRPALRAVPNRTPEPEVEEEEEDEKPVRRAAPARQPARPSNNGGGKKWDGSYEFKFGKKHSGKTWSEIPDGYLSWMSENVTADNDYNTKIVSYLEKELARREETGDSVADEPRQGAKKSQRRSGQTRRSVDDF